ncbi:hypothetical protein [Pyrobaculum aerophilum]|uniref:Uncharacterized protein n=1 Tax=Pyrobaculum aerophilum TaxID=13773 RepID=A0A832WEJ7_9CREN|nr:MULTISPECIES: hypothetical protein [Pyrobaculum]MCX8137356.1 hypothetical protein [Pyrobaculum aerophilum]HII46586.1 hypothetical protein [Pyrobaculum aerophilum]
MAVARADIETLKCIRGESNWDFCLRLKKAKEALAELETKIEKLLEKLP